MNRFLIIVVTLLVTLYGFSENAGGAKNVSLANPDSTVVSESAGLISLTLPLLEVRPIPDAKGTRALIKVNIPLLRRVLLESSDLQQAEISFKKSGKPAESGATKVTVFRMLTKKPEHSLRAGKDYREQPLATFSTDGKNAEAQQQLAQILQGLLKNEGTEEEWLISVDGTGAPAWDKKNGPALTIGFSRHPYAQIFDNAIRPVNGVYSQVKDGKLFYGSKRLKLWGVNRHDSPNPDLPGRLRKAGFNAIRLWGPKGLWDDKALKTGQPKTSHPGDGSRLDRFDHFFARLKAQGLFVWTPALHAYNPMSRNLKGLLVDDSFIAGGEDWSQWKEAVSDLMAGSKDPNNIYLPLIYFDERTQKVMRAHASAFLNHRNPYTGKRYAEEEAIVVWQVQNENGFTKDLLSGDLDKLPTYFRDQLAKRWNDWLKSRYKDESRLKKAWGELAKGESLDRGTIQLGPTINQRSKFPKTRGEDFVRFAIDLVVEFNKSFSAFCRAQAPAGVGVNIGPFVFDCQYRPSVPWLASSALAGDAISLSAYEWGLSSQLTAPSTMLTLDSSTVKDHATFIYETNSGNTNPFRAEFPLRMAALASRQDWDGVFFHIYHAPNEENDHETPEEKYLAGKLSYMTKSDYWSSAAFGLDPALGASLAIAGRIFLEQAIPPAKAPAIYRLADDAVYSYDNFNGITQAEDTFSRGSRIDFTGQPTGGIAIDRKDAPGDSDSPVNYDIEHGRMIIDTPMAKALVGVTGGKYKFRDGIVVGDFSTPFAAFAMVSADRKPLVGKDPSSTIYMTAANNAANTGFEMDRSVARAGGGFVPPTTQSAAIRSPGHAPIIMDKVGYKTWFPTELSCFLKSYDFALRQVEEKKCENANLVEQTGSHEVFMNVLTIAERGAVMKIPDAESVPIAKNSAENLKETTAATRIGGRVWNPLPGIKWSDNYATAHEKIRDGTFVSSRIGGPDLPPTPDSPIVIYGTPLVLKALANIEIDFHKGQMSKITVTFAQPPELAVAVTSYEKKFGTPAQKSVASNAFETSTVRWELIQKGAGLEIVITETQGSMSMTYTLLPE